MSPRFLDVSVSPPNQVSGKESKADDYVLVPFVDSMNHITTATTELSFSPVSGGLSVSVNR